MIGEAVSHYRVKGKLGEGGMGVVYQATDLLLGRDVALKFLPEAMAGDAEALERFRREARAASALNHPNICTVHEIGEHEGRPFLCMELMEGATLKERLAAGSMPIEEAVRVAQQVSDALAAAHAKGVLHRDVKPANIFLTRAGQAKLLDFGLAQVSSVAGAAAGASATRLTLTGSTVGTVSYMSPEQALGKEVDARADLFSLGVVLYEAATGTLPFRGNSQTAVLDAVLHQAPAAPARLNPDVPPKLEEIITRLLEKDPAVRYQTASDVRAELERLRRQESSVSTPAPEAARRTRRWMVVAMAAVLTLAALAMVAWRQRAVGGGGAGGVRSLAVLPLDDYSPEGKSDYFADGMTEELTSTLANIGTLRVISRTSAMLYKGTHKPLPEIARELNVDAVIEGSVLRSGDKVRITAQLIHGPTDQHLWASSYEGSMRDVLALQSQVAQAIAREIRIKLTPDEQQRLAAARPVDPQAHELYLQGKHRMSAGGEQNLLAGIAYFQQAIEHQPDYAQAYAATAMAYGLLSTVYWPPENAMPKAKAAAEKAVALDDGLAEAHAVLGMARLAYDWNWPEAESEFKRALQLNASDALSHLGYGWYLVTVGRFEEGLAETRKAIELDPLSASIHEGREWALIMARRYEDALREGQYIHQRFPDYSLAYADNGLAYALRGQYREAIAEGTTAVKREDTIYNLAILTDIYAIAGRRAEAEASMARLQERMRTSYVCPYEVASTYAALGDKDRTFSWLDQGIARRADCMVFLNVDPRFAAIRTDPRFRDMLRRMSFAGN